MNVTGYAPDAATGERPAEHVVAAQTLSFEPDQLPVLIHFRGKKYLLSQTKHGGLVMNGTVTIGGQTLRR